MKSPLWFPVLKCAGGGLLGGVVMLVGMVVAENKLQQYIGLYIGFVLGFAISLPFFGVVSRWLLRALGSTLWCMLVGGGLMLFADLTRFDALNQPVIVWRFLYTAIFAAVIGLAVGAVLPRLFTDRLPGRPFWFTGRWFKYLCWIIAACGLASVQLCTSITVVEWLLDFNQQLWPYARYILIPVGITTLVLLPTLAAAPLGLVMADQERTREDWAQEADEVTDQESATERPSESPP